MKKLIILGISISLGSILFFGCSVSGSDEPVKPVQIELSAPKNLSVVFNRKNSSIDLKWDKTSSGVVYEVFRILNNDKDKISSDSHNRESFSDSDFPVNSSISYSVRSYSVDTNQYSVATQSTTITVDVSELAVKNPKASSLEYIDKVKIQWEGITNIDLNPEYEVYRFDAKPASTEASLENAVQIVSTIENGVGNLKYVYDTTATEKKPYYYQIRWKHRDITTSTTYGGKNSDYVLGIFVNSASEITSEPNDDYTKLQYENTFLNMTDLFIYKDGDIKDVDSFKISIVQKNTNMINVKVDLDPIHFGKLKYELIYNDSVILQGLVEGEPCVLQNLHFPEQESLIKENFYFRIIPVTDLECSYSISYSESW